MIVCGNGPHWPERQMESQADTEHDDERYGAIETGDGDVVIYDRDNETAWLQSDTAVAVGER